MTNFFPITGLHAPESPLPIAVAEQHGFGRAGSLIRCQQPPTSRGLNREGLKQPVAHKVRKHLLGFSEPRHTDGHRGPHAHGLKRAILLGIGEVHRCR